MDLHTPFRFTVVVAFLLGTPVVHAADDIADTVNANLNAEQPSAPADTAPVAAPTVTPEPTAEAPQQVAEPTPVEKLPPLEYGPVKKGETLNSIAQLLAPEFEATVEQMSWALYRMNPAAFEKADLTRLKNGILLMVPPEHEIHATTHDTARAQLERRKKESKPAPKKKPVDPETAKLQADLAETKRDADENAKEQALLKRRLVEIEKEIQELLRANAERDAALRKQAAVSR